MTAKEKDKPRVVHLLTLLFLREKEHWWDRVHQDKSGGSESKSYR